MKISTSEENHSGRPLASIFFTSPGDEILNILGKKIQTNMVPNRVTNA